MTLDELKLIRDKYIGCLLGSAIGDALGYAVEFKRYSDIIDIYGENGITEFDLFDSDLAKISDDTQMTYCTAKALVDNNIDDYEKDRKALILRVYKYYVAWQKKQDEYLDESNSPLFQRRAPGHTCLTALRSGKVGTLKNRINDSKGSGGVMRVAPIALLSKDLNKIKAVDMLAGDIAAITHGHDLGIIPSALLAHIINSVLLGEDITDAVVNGLNTIRRLYFDYVNYEDLEKQEKLVNKALELAIFATDDYEAISKLGEGWVAEEAIAIAVYCTVRYFDDFESAIIASVNHNGDSDTTGDIVGAIMGAMVGYSNIPKQFKEHLELKDEIMNLSKAMFNNVYYKELEEAKAKNSQS